MFTFTTSAPEFGQSLKAVSQFSCTDKTLPVICGVRLVALDDRIRLEATDRYMLAVLDVKTEENAGTGELVLPTSTVKTILGCLSAARSGDTVQVSVADDGTYRIRFPDQTEAGYLANPVTFPKTQKLLDDFKPAACHASITLNPRFLATIAKAAGKHDYVTLTPGDSTVTRFECGELTGLLVAVGQAS
jgi:DNA polymerase III sliding clamp (beta) subunit (PCNA family)